MRNQIIAALAIAISTAAFAHHEGGDHPGRPAMHDGMKRIKLDANGDGQVTRDEFMAPHAALFP